MKISGYDAVTEIHITEQELSILGSQRVNLEFFADSPTEWVKITASKSGAYFFNKRDLSKQSHEFPYRTSVGRGVLHFGRFALQRVDVKSPGPGILFGARPDFSLVAKVKARVHGYPRTSGVSVPTTDSVREAVKTINNFIDKHEGVEMSIEEGRLRLRMIMEF